MLVENNLFGLVDKVKIAVERLRKYEEMTEGEGYYLAFSGGKDSVVIKALADMSGVKYDAHYSVTGIDPPELVYFIREHHSDVIFNKPEIPFLQKLPIRGFPLRHRRWCCEYLKVRNGKGRIVLTGIRRAESNSRGKRQMLEGDTLKSYLHPIIDWKEEDVWEFIRKHNLPYCKLYNEGWKRIGCLFCPFATPNEKRRCVERYPKFTEAFRRAFRRLYANRKATPDCTLAGVDNWKDGDEMFDWWISG
jgi:phosphoadenosine phosphosulfate reductase